MLRKSLVVLTTPFRHFSDRLDELEKEMIDLKAFRKAVETTNPEVAQAAKSLIEKQKAETKEILLTRDNPLTPDEFVELNQFYAQQQPKAVRLGDLQYIKSKSDLRQHANFIHREYLVRIAQRARSLNNAPYGLSQMPSIHELKKCYQWSFHDMRSTPAPSTEGELHGVDHLLRRIFLRHYNVSGLVSHGLLELGKRENWTHVDEALSLSFSALHDFFEEFCYGRAALRFLVGNYMYLSHQILNVKEEEYLPYDPERMTAPLYFDHDPSDFVGQICTKTSLLKLLKVAIKEAKATYDEADIKLVLSGSEDQTFLGIPYITYDIISAMLEDAMLANFVRQEKFGTPCSDICLILSQHPGSEEYVVRISDSGGGFPLEQTNRALTFWSTFKAAEDSALFKDNRPETWIHSPIRLPYAYCASRVIGGHVSIASIEGYGTDRQLYLPAAGVESLIV